MALLELSRQRPNIRSRVAAEIAEAVVGLAIERPAWGQLRVANALVQRGLAISAAGGRRVWQRHDLTAMKHRLKALEAKVAEGRGPTGSAGRVRQRVPRPLRGATF